LEELAGRQKQIELLLNQIAGKKIDELSGTERAKKFFLF
jgi:hypothetical protein